MINLLPPELKQNYDYARRNSSLLRIVTAFGLGIIGLAVISGAGLLYLQQSTNTYKAQAKVIQEKLTAEKQGEIEKQVSEISGSLKLAVQVLSREILFSKLLNQLAVVTPSKVSLNSLNIIKFGGGIDIVAQTGSLDAATQLQVNMVDPDNRIFEKADIVSISCEAKVTETNKSYPCQASIRGLFATDNPFQFINSKVGG